jgi:hypothetical protein
MNVRAPKSPYLYIAALLSIFVLTSLACSFGSLNIDNGSATVDLTFDEDQVNRWLSEANDHENQNDRDDVMDQITRVEMHDGFIRAFGYREEGGRKVEGSFDATVKVEDDILYVVIVDVDMEGVDMSDPRIERANREMQEGLTKSVTDSNGEVRYREASITEEELHLQVQVDFQR